MRRVSPRVFTSLEEFASATGTDLGPGEWLVIDQKRIDLFAEATGDDQWIHVDPGRAASGPFGATVAHGYLTLWLLPVLVRELYRVDGVGMRVNYGVNKVRFPAPVHAGHAVRALANIARVDPMPDGGYQVVLEARVESDRGGKPACVAETVSRLYPSRDQA